ncbi:hypothetical protein [Streptomyces erythrochromogenes]|uniref:hypothetical protein n=1 Tax=Streptomyces erythrochromogenes TaxID=285574 RepID=UPI0037FA917A
MLPQRPGRLRNGRGELALQLQLQVDQIRAERGREPAADGDPQQQFGERLAAVVPYHQGRFTQVQCRPGGRLQGLPQLLTRGEPAQDDRGIQPPGRQGAGEPAAGAQPTPSVVQEDSAVVVLGRGQAVVEAGEDETVRPGVRSEALGILQQPGVERPVLGNEPHFTADPAAYPGPRR